MLLSFRKSASTASHFQNRYDNLSMVLLTKKFRRIVLHSKITPISKFITFT